MLTLLRAAVWRFGTLPFALKHLGGFAEGVVVSRRFAGRRLFLEIARSNAQKLLFLEGERYVPERTLLRRLAKPGATVIDVGANIGYFALLFAEAVGEHGRVLCVEPDPANLRELRRNVERNGLSNVEVLATAAGSRDGMVGLMTGLNSRVTDDGAGVLQVPVRMVDSIAPERVDLLKVDVEGFEWEVLKGAARVIEAGGATVWLELHPALLPDAVTPRDILEWLAPRCGAVRFFVPSQPRSTVGKLLRRYWGSEIGAMPFDQANLEARIADRHGEPIWVVASSRAP